MSKSVASETIEHIEAQELGGKRGAEYEGNEDGEEFHEVPPAESLPISTVVSTAPAVTDQFMHTPDFMRLLAELVQDVCTLKALRLATKEWKRVVEEEIIIHNGKNRRLRKEEEVNDLRARREPVKRVVFYPNITKVGEFACHFVINLVVVDIPEGVTSISDHTFCWCKSLTRVSFPKTLTSIGESAFYHCDSLDNVDLLNTNLQELGEYMP